MGISLEEIKLSVCNTFNFRLREKRKDTMVNSDFNAYRLVELTIVMSMSSPSSSKVDSEPY